ncbi:motility protein A [Deferribacter autotrophicus]|uniref:Motility protein A n=1 Tax=Deferribacter autotrophicus TaxID=500465 RepID=A0A5A8F5P1_9BACT|nr:MotA/TolQ/ExbB proton channel family protein [Deferribacter autotrophicus]KAA0258420.1 motility protein A [Deferribacter autotrophicus]
MDIATLIGIVLAYVLVFVSLLMGPGVGVYIDIPSVLIVIGGTFGIIFMNYPMNKVFNIIAIVMKTFLFKSEDPAKLIEQLVNFAVRARRDGILALESAENEISDEFLKKGIRLAVDGTEPEVIKSILETELSYMEERHKEGVGILESIASFAPAMGMIGTLIGLVAMLQTMNDPSSIGPAMAVALLTTFYGAIIANLFAAPLAGKLKTRSAEEILLREIMIAGIMAIQAGDNPRIVEQKLNAYLPPKMRKSQFE